MTTDSPAALLPPKPLALISVETCDEARCHVLGEHDKLQPVWKIAQEAKDKAEEDLLEGQGAAREKFPDTAYDAETSRAMNDLSADHERKLGRFRALDSRKRSLSDKIKKLTADTLRLVGEMREPGLWAAGEKAGPDAWRQLKLRSLVGGPDPDKEIDKQDWTSRELEEAGYHNIDEFLKGRARLIAGLIDNGDLAADTVAEVDSAVYRWLEKRNMLAHWPKGIAVPAGGQLVMTLEDAGGATLLDAVAPEPGTPIKPKKGTKAKPEASDEPAPALDAEPMPTECPNVLGPDLYDAATTGRKGTDFSKAKNAAGIRVQTMMKPWRYCLDLARAEDEDVTDDGVIERFASVYGATPAAMFQRLLYWAWEGKRIPQSPVSEGTTELFITSALWLSDHLAHEAHRAGWLPDTQAGEEVVLGWCRAMAKLEREKFDEAMMGLAELCGDLASVLRIHVKFPPAEPEPAEPEPAANPYGGEIVEPAPAKPATKKPAKKSAGKKHAANKRGKKATKK